MYYVVAMFNVTLSGFLPLLPMMAALHLALVVKGKKRPAKTPVAHIAAVYLFCFVLSFVFTMTNIPDLYHITVDATVNLLPFADLSTNLHQYALNVALFVPVGFLLPALWKRYEKPLRTLACGFLLSLAIEIAQIFSSRFTDIDDLLMNTAGAVVGYYFFVLVRRVFPGVSVFAIDREDHWKREPFFAFCLTWLSFFLFQPLVMGRLFGYIIR